jgi:hypothetical protein
MTLVFGGAALVAMAIFIAALTGRVSERVGSASGAAVAAFALLPAGCVYRDNPTEIHECRTLAGLPIPSEIVGLGATLCVAAILSMTASIRVRHQ